MNTTCQELFDILATYASEEDQAWVRKAYDYSASALAGQTLRNGAPRLDWALTMAHILALLHADKTVIAAGFLFYAALNAVQCEDDVVKDVKTRFGQDTADIVRGALRIEQMRWRNGENQHDTFLTMGEDIRVLFVVLADRLCAARFLFCQPRFRKERFARECAALHLPMARRLGLRALVEELEDRCRPYL